MHELFERPGLYANVHDWLYIFELCAVKSSNESVVESMGNIIDQHAAPGRHLNPEEYAREAFIHWNGPQLHRADRFLAASLNRHFKVSWPGGWRFTNVTRRMEMLNFKHTSKVVDRLQRRPSKFPFLECVDTSSLGAGLSGILAADYSMLMPLTYLRTVGWP